MERCNRIVGEHAGHRRKVADISVHHAEQCGDGGLVRSDGVEVAH